MSPGEVGGQPVRTVALVDVDVLVLPIANLNRDGQELLAASLALHFSGLLGLGEALAELRGLVGVRQVAVLRGQARLVVLEGAAQHLGRRHLVDRREPLGEIRVLVERVRLVGQGLLALMYVHVARHWVNRRDVRLSQEVLRVVVVPGPVPGVPSRPLLHLNIIVLLEVIDAGIEPLHLPDIVLIQLVLILVVMAHALSLGRAAGEFAAELHVRGGLRPRCRPVVSVLQGTDAAEAARVRERLLLVLGLVVHAGHVVARIA